jgi:hypothetical protein
VLWRDDELKPVPDSMTQFVDYASIFGKQALHCGVVVKQEHRHWVHVVGTEYDLIEWDVPKYDTLGVGGPLSTIPVKPPANQQGQPPPQQPQQPQVDQMQLMLICSQGVEEARARQALIAVHPGGADEAMMWLFTGDAGNGGSSSQEEPHVGVDFDGVHFDRKVDPYNQEPWSVEAERWGVDILKPVINAVFPPDDDVTYIHYNTFNIYVLLMLLLLLLLLLFVTIRSFFFCF